MYHLYGVDFINANNGFTTGEDSTLLNTSDGSNTLEDVVHFPVSK